MVVEVKGGIKMIEKDNEHIRAFKERAQRMLKDTDDDDGPIDSKLIVASKIVRGMTYDATREGDRIDAGKNIIYNLFPAAGLFFEKFIVPWGTKFLLADVDGETYIRTDAVYEHSELEGRLSRLGERVEIMGGGAVLGKLRSNSGTFSLRLDFSGTSFNYGCFDEDLLKRTLETHLPDTEYRIE
jgi:hypothetical protein